MRNEICACLVSNLETVVDTYMISQRFTRNKKSLIYVRRQGGATQTIDMALEIHPQDRRDASAAIYPRMEVQSPLVDRVLDNIVGTRLGLLEGVTGGRTKQPIAFTSEKRHEGRWFIFQPDSVPGVVKDIKIFLERWTIPLLDVYFTPEDILAAHEREDGRIARDRAQIMRVVAAALVLDKFSHAQALMEKSFGAPGPRRRYQQVFGHIEKRLSLSAF